MYKLILIFAFLLLFTTNLYADKLETMQKQAETGDAQAQYEMALHFRDDIKPPDFETYFKWLTKAADQDHPRAVYEIGMAYAFGWGVEENGLEALKWLNQAIELDNNDGYYGIGRMYFTGAAVERDYDEAYKWWTKAAELGNYSAETDLKRYYRDSQPITNVDDLMAKAESGDMEAQTELGTIYAWGRLVKRDPEKALHWLTKAAEAGSTDALSKLAQYSFVFLRNHVSPEEAQKWQEKAALQGDSGALSTLIYGYLIGRQNDDGYGYFERNQAEALKWIKVGIEQNDVATLNMAAAMYATGMLIPRDYNHAAELYVRAIEKADESRWQTGSMFDLARMYAADRITADLPATAELPLPPGATVEESAPHTAHYVNAAKWYYQAAMYGHTEAPYYLARLLTTARACS